MNSINFSSQGLSSKQAAELLSKYGFNEINKATSFKILPIFLSQFSSPLIILLIVAALVSLLLNFFPGQSSDIFDGILILVIVLLSGLAGFVQDYKAEKTMESLRRLSEPKATVLRDGKESKISSTEVVPTDIVILNSGDIVPADMELLQVYHLSCDESVLTGESRSIIKQVGDKVYKGSSVQVGRAIARVTATGMNTKLGSIALGLEEIKEEKTPFQNEIQRLSRSALWFILGIVVFILIIGMIRFSFFDSFMLAISLAVAAIPEGLPAVLTVVLAMGAHAMMRKKALVRRLSSVETMGDVEVICTDKTGTLTCNEMSVVSLHQDGKQISVPGLGHDVIQRSAGVHQLILCGTLCNDTRLELDKDGRQVFLGDQTEVALAKLAEQILSVGEVSAYSRVDEIPFTSERKLMTVVCKNSKDKKSYIYTKGAPEILLNFCNRQMGRDGKIEKLDKKIKQKILEQYKKYGADALRVLGCAYRNKVNNDAKEADLIWLGLVAMTDPPRKEVSQAIRDVREAGIRVIMLTGDHAHTAETIARMIGLPSRGVIEGDKLEQMEDNELAAKLREGYNIFARISPFHKLRILRFLQQSYNNVAMTGDGVNDALALKQADIGISMGARGTDVAKSASDIVLLDDNFSSIRDAVAEGRRSLDNIKKFINYLSVSNLAEVGVLFIATLVMNLPEPILLPVHILWINLITDGLPAIALGLDPMQADILKHPPRRGQPLVDSKLKAIILGIGIKKMVVLFVTFILILPYGLPLARTVLFTGFILYEFVRIATIRQQDHIGWFANKWLISALAGSLALQLFVIYTPLNKFFKVLPLGLYPWLVLLAGVSVGYFSAIFITRWINKRFASP